MTSACIIRFLRREGYREFPEWLAQRKVGKTEGKDDILEAHKLLMIPISSPKDNEFNVIILFRYYYKHKIQAIFSNEKDRILYKQMRKDALDRLTKYIDANPVYEKDLRNMKKDLFAAYCLD